MLARFFFQTLSWTVSAFLKIRLRLGVQGGDSRAKALFPSHRTIAWSGWYFLGFCPEKSLVFTLPQVLQKEDAICSSQRTEELCQFGLTNMLCFILKVLMLLEVSLLLWSWPLWHTDEPPSMSWSFLWPLLDFLTLRDLQLHIATSLAWRGRMSFLTAPCCPLLRSE